MLAQPLTLYILLNFLLLRPLLINVDVPIMFWHNMGSLFGLSCRQIYKDYKDKEDRKLCFQTLNNYLFRSIQTNRLAH